MIEAGALRAEGQRFPEERTALEDRPERSVSHVST